MYVKWEDRLSRRGTAAVLVEARRIDGKPRQRHIAYLATYPGGLWSIGEDAHNVHTRTWFWYRLTQRLAKLDLSAKQQKHVKASVAKRLPKPTQDEITAYDQARQAGTWEGRGFPRRVNWPPVTRGVARRPRRRSKGFPAVLAAAQGAR
jgi:hypothetical protein